MKRAAQFVFRWQSCLVISTMSFFLFFFPPSSFAATFTFDNVPTQINDDTSFAVSVIIDGLSAGNVYYLRGDFSHVDTPTSYFGYTKNNVGSWYNAEPSLDHTQLYQITMQEGNVWSGSIEVKVDVVSSKYKGNGEYNFKMRRYTSSGASYSWADQASRITIVSSITPTSVPTPTVEPTNKLVPTRAPTPTKTSTPKKAPTSVPTTKPTATVVPSVTPTPKPVNVVAELTSSNKSNASPPALPKEILGESITKKVYLSPTPNISPTIVSKVMGNSQGNMAKILIGLGIILLASCGILAFKYYKENKKNPLGV